MLKPHCFSSLSNYLSLFRLLQQTKIGTNERGAQDLSLKRFVHTLRRKKRERSALLSNVRRRDEVAKSFISLSFFLSFSLSLSLSLLLSFYLSLSYFLSHENIFRGFQLFPLKKERKIEEESWIPRELEISATKLFPDNSMNTSEHYFAVSRYNR